MYILLCALWMQSCVINDDDITPPAGTSRDVTISVEIPELQPPVTRSMDGEKESYVNEVDIFTFEVNDADPDQVVELFSEHVTGTILRNSVTGQTYKVEVKATLTRATANRIVILTNVASQVAAALAGITAGTPKKTVLERLTYTSGPWAAGTSGGTFQAIPMYGETGIVTIKPGQKIEGIQLRRMVARIDVVNQADLFSLEKIYLCNYNTVGRIAPGWRASDGQIPATPPSSPNLPANPGKQSTPAIYTPFNQRLEGEIYTFESAAADNAGEPARRDASCLVVEGMYHGEKNFYRVDFTYTRETEGQPVRYMPLLRNYNYEVNILSAAGRGYDTFEEALDSYTVPSNLMIRILSYDMSVIKEIDFNGQYMLGVSQTSYTLPATALQTPTPTGRLSIFTNYPQGWEVADIKDEAGNDPVDWLTLSAMSGAGDVITYLYISLDENTGASRSARITLKAGRLIQQICVSQQCGD